MTRNETFFNYSLISLRYKVKADYPFAKFNKGDIIHEFEGTNLLGVAESLFTPETLDSYPHLFRCLKWYENRKVEEMPMYLKTLTQDLTEIEFVFKVTKYCVHPEANQFWAFEYLWKNEPDTKRMSLNGWEPATEKEYLKYNELNK